MTDATAVAERIAALDEHDRERLLTAVTAALAAHVGELAVADERDARELIAACAEHAGLALAPAAIAPPEADPYVVGQAALAMLAEDEETAPLVASTLDALGDESQMVADPITIAVALTAIVAFLQTKLTLHVRRSKDGKVLVDLDVSKDPTSAELIGKVIAGVKKASSL